MSVYFYDEALVAKLKAWTGNTQINIFGPSETRRMFEVMADKSGDKPIQLPIISLKRRGGFTIENPNKKPLTYDGMMIEAVNEKSFSLNAIPISIPYQLDVYTRYYKEADTYIRNLIFNIINYPTLKVNIPYEDTNFEHCANIRLSSSVDDNSDIPERLISGQFTRMSLTIDIDDAYLWDVRVRNNVYIDSEAGTLEIYKPLINKDTTESTDFIAEQL